MKKVIDEITAELKRKGLTKHAKKIEKVIADSDEYTTIYFDLVFEEEDYDEDESKEVIEELDTKAYNYAQKLFEPFGSIDNEGYDSYGTLICKFAIKKSDLPELKAFIEKNDTTINDGIIEIDLYFKARGFEIVEEPGTSEGIPFEDWDEYIEDMESNSESSVSANNEMTMREALKKSNWEAFRNSQNEEWNVTDLLNEFPEAEDDKWLDQTMVYLNPDSIVEVDGDDEFFEV